MADKTLRNQKTDTDKQKRKKQAEKPTTAATQVRPAEKDAFPVVALGASAGGLEAFEQFFRNLPEKAQAAFVVISHLDPKHSSIMAELISRFSSLTVHEAADGMEVEPCHIYVIPPNKDLAIFNGKLQLTEQEKSAGTRMPIDHFLRSLAEDAGDRAVAIILSGTGSDGTLGLRAIQGTGGIVFVQDPNDAKYDGMPRSAIRTGLADQVVPAAQIPKQLMSYLERYRTGKHLPPEDQIPQYMQKILMTIRSKTGHDFSLYKKNTVLRRIRRRISIHNIDDAGTYLRYLQEHPEEIHQLFKELLINVTSFFREPEAFDILKKVILPALLHDKPSDYGIRVWVPGCATGEEAYSIAMVIREYAEEKRQDYRLQMFATDIDEDSITQARTGFFPMNIALDVRAERLAKFFTKEETGYRVRKDIRESIVFATQNMTKDAPFTKLDLVSCRNVLIYMEPELQSRLISLFHYSLKPSGVLFLGSSETIGSHTGLFSIIDRKWKFFQAKPTASHEIHAQAPAPAWPLETTEHVPAKPKRASLEEVVRSALLSAFAPPAMIVNGKGDILYIHGNTGKYLTPNPGRPTMNVSDMTREGLNFHVRAALLAAGRNPHDTIYRGVRVKTNGETEAIDLIVKPLLQGDGEEPLFMFTFQAPAEPKAEKAKKGKGKAETADARRIAELEKELAYTKESLQASVEEAQATNEELRSANEEMQSTNEELQSTNEEMETSKEELQSVNEELTTVNSELQSKIEQLSRVENDMKNLLDSTEIATIFLDADLHVKRFTASASKVISLIPTDVGRPIGDITTKIDYSGITGKAQEVLDRLRPFEAEVRGKDERWYLMRILPYRTLENVIDGVVITFTDITESKWVARAEFAENIVQTVREPLIVLDDELRVIMANRAFYKLFQVKPSVTESRVIGNLGGHEWDIPVLRELLKKVLKTGKVFEDFRVEADFPGIGPRTMLLNARKIKAATDEAKPLVLLAVEDITAVKQKAGRSSQGRGKNGPKRQT